MVLLHGTGADEQDLVELGTALADVESPPLAVLSLRAPLRAPFGGYRWFEGYSSAPEQQALETTIAESARAVIACIQAAPKAFGTDPDRVALVGESTPPPSSFSAT